jgi:hypothetical protein
MIRPIAGTSATATTPASQPRAAATGPRASFEAALRPDTPPPSTTGASTEPQGLLQRFSRALEGIEERRESIDRAIRRAARGQSFSPSELLVLQSRVYAHSHQMEVISRSVDRMVGSLKTTLNTQV